MSQTEHDNGHQSPIKTHKQLITVVALAFLVPILVIVLLSQYLANIGANRGSRANRPENQYQRGFRLILRVALTSFVIPNMLWL